MANSVLKPIIDTQKEVAKIIVGQQKVVQRLLVALLADGHVLIEGLPGLAKTLAVNTLSKAISCDFKRIQFTPDLLPADLIGTQIWDPKESAFKVSKGPIFTNILLADEINRAPAKVQSALLEVMQEHQVTIGGTSFKLDEPFLVLATQNPIEHEGTYTLPEAQTDRFLMKIKIDYPSKEEEKEILKRMATLQKPRNVEPVLTKEALFSARQAVDELYIDEKVIDYILKVIDSTRSPPEKIKEWLLFGASPRATIAFKIASKALAFLKGKDYVSPEEIKEIAPDILRHRLRRTYAAEAEGVTPDEIIKHLLDSIPVP